MLAPYRSVSGQRIRIEGPAINVTPQTAVTLALSLHELATNAVKYGALSGPQGTVSLGWAIESGETDAMVRLSWTEAGGPLVAAPTRRGYGTSFIRSAIRGMGGAIDFQFRAEGLSCEIAIPAEMFVTHAPGASAPTGTVAQSGHWPSGAPGKRG